MHGGAHARSRLQPSTQGGPARCVAARKVRRGTAQVIFWPIDECGSVDGHARASLCLHAQTCTCVPMCV